MPLLFEKKRKKKKKQEKKEEKNEEGKTRSGKGEKKKAKNPPKTYFRLNYKQFKMFKTVLKQK